MTAPAPQTTGRPSETGNLVVRYVRTGGVAPSHVELNLDTDRLPAAEAAELKRLAVAADVFDLPAQIANGVPVSDGFACGVTISVGRRRHAVSTQEGDGSGAVKYPRFFALLAWLDARATGAL